LLGWSLRKQTRRTRGVRCGATLERAALRQRPVNARSLDSDESETFFRTVLDEYESRMPEIIKCGPALRPAHPVLTPLWSGPFGA
jgi:hypothetical protein